MPSPTPPPAPRVPTAVARAWLVLGAAVLAIVVYDVVRILRLGGGRAAPPVALDHDGRVGGGSAAPLHLAVLGDSAAAGFGLVAAEDAYPRQVAAGLAVGRRRPVQLVSLAENGARIADVTRRQVARLPLDCEVVVVAAGVNDALGRRPPSAVGHDTRALVAALRDRVPDAEILLVGCPDLRTAPGFPWPLNRLAGWSCRRVCDSQERACRGAGVGFVRYPRPPAREMYGADGFHPGPAGHAAAAAATLDALRGD